MWDEKERLSGISHIPKALKNHLSGNEKRAAKMKASYASAKSLPHATLSWIRITYIYSYEIAFSRFVINAVFQQLLMGYDAVLSTIHCSPLLRYKAVAQQ